MNERSYAFTFTLADGWLLYLLIAAALLVGWWTWRRYGPAAAGAAGRIGKTCRVAALVLLVLMLGGPAWRITTTITDPGRLLLVVDTSASMATGDLDEAGAARIEALPRLRAALAELDAARTQISLVQAGGEIGPLQLPLTATPATTGISSPLGSELEQLAAGHAPDAIILVSDGRVTAGSSLEAIARRFANRNEPAKGVWVLGVGTEQVEPELRIEEVLLPRQIPLGERQPLRVKLAGRSLSDDDITIRVWLGEKLLDEIKVPPPEAESELSQVTLEALLDKLVIQQEGEHRLRVEVTQNDLQQDSSVAISVQERKMQVLLLAHRPRWELRYLKEALRRDQTIEVHAYLCDGRWRPWGETPHGQTKLPLDAQTLKDYDAIIIGDFGPDQLMDLEVDNLAEAVEKHAAGLIWLPGSRGATAGFRGTRLGRLLPVRLPAQADIAAGYLGNQELHVRRTEQAASYGLLSADAISWPDLPPLRGFTPLRPDAVLPGARVLMEGLADGTPLVVVRDFGAGKSLFIGFDETWRWRRGVGDKHLHQFYSQLLRYVSGNRALSDHAWRVIPSPARTLPGELVQLGVIPTGAAPDISALPKQATVQLQGPDGRTLVVSLDRPLGEASYLATIPAPAPGTWLIDVLDLAGDAETAELLVLPPSAEVRDPRIDRVALAQLAEDTGGRAFFPREAGTKDAYAALAAALPALSKEHQRVDHDSLWDSWWLLLLLVGLWSVDWAIRRWHRLP